MPDSAWLQLNPDCTLESSLRTLDHLITVTQGKIRRIFSGHNDEILDGERYLSALREAFTGALAGGEEALKPSYRSAAESFGSGTMASSGDWRIDSCWAAANLRFLYDADRDAVPPRYVKGFDVSLSELKI